MDVMACLLDSDLDLMRVCFVGNNFSENTN